MTAEPGAPEIGTTTRNRLITVVLAIAAAAVFAGCWLLVRQLTAQAYYGTADITDIPVYFDFMKAFAAGGLPYRDIGTAYPPGAFPAFVIPWLVSGGEDAAYTAAFLSLMLGVGILVTEIGRAHV